MIDIKEFENMMMFDLPEEEREVLGRRLNAVAGGFAALGQVGTDDAEPLVTVLVRNNVLREDKSEKLVTRDELLSSAPECLDGYFKVPETL